MTRRRKRQKRWKRKVRTGGEAHLPQLTAAASLSFIFLCSAVARFPHIAPLLYAADISYSLYR